MPLGPVVRHTGELNPDWVISELVVFGLPARSGYRGGPAFRWRPDKDGFASAPSLRQPASECGET